MPDWNNPAMLKAREERIAVFRTYGKLLMQGVTVLEDCACYELEEEKNLYRLNGIITHSKDEETRKAAAEQYAFQLKNMHRKQNAPEKILLWNEGNMPCSTEYTDNSDFRYNHNPDFIPYMYALRTDQDHPKGVVVVCAGGDHGRCVLTEGLGSCMDLNALGYHCFLLLNRTNHNPWSVQEAGADASRAIRYVRAHAEEYGISADRVAFAGFSNGGVTGEGCIRYYSGTQTVQDSFADYVPDELDAYYGAPDAFLNIYGPRFENEPFDYEGVVYPPVFFAEGREDFGMANLRYVCKDLQAHGIPHEVHTFAGVPHGMAGMHILGESKYRNFDLWPQLADAFLDDVYSRRK